MYGCAFCALAPAPACSATKSRPPANAVPQTPTMTNATVRFMAPPTILRRESREFYSPRTPPSIREPRFEKDLAGAGRRIAEFRVALAEKDEGAERQFGGVPDSPCNLREDYGGELRIFIADLRHLERAEQANEQLIREELEIAADDEIV